MLTLSNPRIDRKVRNFFSTLATKLGLSPDFFFDLGYVALIAAIWSGCTAGALTFLWMLVYVTFFLLPKIALLTVLHIYIAANELGVS